MSCSTEDDTWGWGFLISVTDSGDSLKWIGTGISLVGASGPILTIVNCQVCHVLVVVACMLVKHCMSVESILRGGASILPASSRRRSIRGMLAVAFLSSSRKRRHLLQIIIILFILFSLGVFDYGT